MYPSLRSEMMWSRRNFANSASPVVVRWTPSLLNQRFAAAWLLAAFQSATTSWGHVARAASSAAFVGA